MMNIYAIEDITYPEQPRRVFINMAHFVAAEVTEETVTLIMFIREYRVTRAHWDEWVSRQNPI